MRLDLAAVGLCTGLLIEAVVPWMAILVAETFDLDVSHKLFLAMMGVSLVASILGALVAMIRANRS